MSEFDAKFDEMQKYLPLVEQFIDKLKGQENNPRKEQLHKMETLHYVLSNKSTKLTMDMLLKCERIIKTLQTKAPFLQSKSSKSEASAANKEKANKVSCSSVEIVDITGPASPPPQPVEEVQPVEIPTERRCSPLATHGKHSKHWDHNASRDHHDHDRNKHKHYQNHSSHKSYSRDHSRDNRDHGNKNQHDRDSAGSRRSTDRMQNNEISLPNTSDRGIYSRDRISRSSWNSLPLERNYNSSTSQATSDVSNQPDRTLATYKNPEDPLHKISPSHGQRSREILLSQPHCRISSKTNNDEAYSPEESWDEVTKKQDIIPTIDLINKSPTPPCDAEVNKAYHDAIFNFKKRGTSSQDKEEKRIFSRLGNKVEAVDISSTSGAAKPHVYENFKVNVVNEHASVSGNRVVSSKSAPVSVPVKIPTIPEVLQSPPLSANDISNLLNESMDVVPSSSNSIAEIGTRRPPKPCTNTSNSSTSELDMVRKKFALITKNSTQFRESSGSPASISSMSNMSPRSLSCERLALKYNPHRRGECSPATSSGNTKNLNQNKALSPNDPRLSSSSKPLTASLAMNVNVLPSINPQDPRLRRSAFTTSPISPVHLASPPFQAHVEPPCSNFTTQNGQKFMHASSRPPEPVQQPYHDINYIDPRIRHSATTPAFSNISRTTVDSFNTVCNVLPASRIKPAQAPSPATPAFGNISRKTVDSFNTVSNLLPAQRIKPAQAPTPAKNYSSEENWDSEPETPLSSSKTDKPLIQYEKNKSLEPSAECIASPEENWDSVSMPPTELSTHVHNASSLHTNAGKKWQNIKSSYVQQNSKAFKRNPKPQQTAVVEKISSGEENWDSDPETGSEPVKAKTTPSLSTAPIALSATQTSHKAPTPQYRFSALLNDKSERIKYFEAKKKKQSEPRTYAEFRQAKARAAAEEAAKKLAEETAKKAEEDTKKTVEKSVADKVVKKASEPTKISSVNKPKESDNVAPQSSASTIAPTSTLDKLYRSSNFKNCEFPKANSSFKIPKKTGHVKIDEKVEDKEKSITKCSKIVASEREKKHEEKNLKEKRDIALDKSKSAVDLKAGNEEIEKNQNLKEKRDTAIDKNKPKLDLKSQNLPEAKELKAKDTNNKKETSCVLQYAKTEIEKISSSSKNKYNKISSTPFSRVDEKTVSSPEEEEGKKCESEQASETVHPSQVFKAARILKRRCTMITYGSTPEVDKAEILSSRALLFEDIQQRGNTSFEESTEKQVLKRNKNLADIFQRTDDNCQVSTQNIITGKRRTRAAVNFNEVQQAQLVFKHKKPSPPKRDPEDNTKRLSLPKAPDSKANKLIASTCVRDVKSAADIASAKLKINMDNENQDGVVSSTTVQLDEDAKVDGSRTPKIVKGIKENNYADEEPSSSEQSVTVASTLSTDETDNGKHKLLEGFVQGILKPDADTTYIFSLLQQILSEEKLQQVKVIIESAAKENAKTTDELADEEDDGHDGLEAELDTDAEDKVLDKLEKCTKNAKVLQKPKIAPKRTYRKRNELDRLNDDIRDMFISEGVLTATGRRMCTLVAASSADKGQDCSEDKRKTEKKSPTTATAKSQMSPEQDATDVKATEQTHKGLRMRKAKVVLSPLNDRQLRRSGRTKLVLDNFNTNLGPEEESSNDMGTTTDTPAVIQSSMRDELNDTSASPRVRRMPTLKPHTPIKISEVVDHKKDEIEVKQSHAKKRKLEVKLPKMKPPKINKDTPDDSPVNTSKDSTNVDSDNEDNLELSSLKQQIKSGSLHKESLKLVEGESVVKNINMNWHSQSKYAKWCVLCNTKLNYTAMHYKMQHDENYASRLAPTILQQFKQGKLSKPLFGVSGKKPTLWFYRCPFCLQHNRSTVNTWMEHFTTHTGEYYFECSQCHKAANKLNLIEKHIKVKCIEAKVIRNETRAGSSNASQIRAYVCHLCNFLQMDRKNLERHYIQHHDCDDEKVDVLGYSFNLINVENVELVDNKIAAEMEFDAVKSFTKESMVIEDDNDNINSNLDTANSNESKETKTEIDEKKEVKSVIQSSFKLQSDVSESNDGVKSDEKATESKNTSNAFMPTRETSRSPTIDSFAQKLLTIEDDDHSNTESTKTSASKVKSIFSIAERLSQRFKDLKEHASGSETSSEALTESKKTADQTEKLTEAKNHTELITSMETESPKENRAEIITSDKTIIPDAPGNNQQKQMEKSDSNSNCNAEYKAKEMETELNCSDADSKSEDDDNWEDIEITESAPSAPSSSSNVCKVIKSKNKSIFQKFSRLYAPSNKSKKNVFNISHKKKQANQADKICHPASNENSNENTTIIEHLEGVSGFRPMITNLADLLPDSPCNDPIELVPELTPLEPLQDLNDISSILDSNLGSLVSHNLQHPLNPSISNALCIDSQQTSIQEALDFVSEQEQNDALNITSVPKIVTAPQQINRIHNIGFSSLNEDFKFYCLSDHCTFLYSNEAIGLENHYINEHPLAKWSGLCNMCREQVLGIPDKANEFSLTQEIRHMMEKHVKLSSLTFETSVGNPTNTKSSTPFETSVGNPTNTKSSTAFETSVGNPTNTKSSTAFETSVGNPTNTKSLTAFETSVGNPTNTKSSTAFETSVGNPTDTKSSTATKSSTSSSSGSVGLTVESPVAQIADEEKPRIKIRRLTGDMLSTNSCSSSGVNLVRTCSIFDENTNLSDLLNAKPKPPTKQMPPRLDMPLTDPLFSDSALSFKDNSQTFRNISTDFAITSVSSMVEPKSSCPLQIAQVVSLNELSRNNTAANIDTVPKIANVRSLSSQASGKAGDLWAQHIENERIDLEAAAAESLEVSRILANASNPSAANRLTTASNDTSDSPEPLVIAETVPVAQATAGDFLITQTVSAQYEQGTSGAQIGFNISIATANPLATPAVPNLGSCAAVATSLPITTTISNTQQNYTRPHYKCMGTGCKFVTRVTVAMSDHLRFHECQHFSTQRDYLRCSLCPHLAKDVDDYINHAEQDHFSAKNVPTSEPKTTSLNELTKKIQNILKRTPKSIDGEANDAARDTSNTQNSTPATGMVKTYKEHLEETIKEIIAKTGVPDALLYRCVVEGCKTKLNEFNFHNHVVYHLSTSGNFNSSNYSYKCPHCKVMYKYNKPAAIKSHYKLHTCHRYFCYICMDTAQTVEKMQKHFSEKHWTTRNIHVSNLLKWHQSMSNSDAPVYFVAHSQKLGDIEVQQFGEKLIAEWQRKKAGPKTIFKPSEIALLPIQPIFRNEVFCASCMYKTKVRTNMLRHLQMHGAGGGQQMANMDPVNPVPCLNTNEKHFDKMTNLASSGFITHSSATSATSGVKVPAKTVYEYIPEMKRYTCGVAGCQYLTVSDDIFRAHVNALHSNITSYSCPFCKEEICKRGMSADRIVQHLRFHGHTLYQCENCEYMHYMKNVVERHIHDKHATQHTHLITHDRQNNPEKTSMELIAAKAPTTGVEALSIHAKPESSCSKVKYKWQCDLCSVIVNTHAQIVTHCQSHHATKHQYQCIHCTHGAQQLSQILTHIDEKHAGKTREVRRIFSKIVENQSAALNDPDTRPLWQRDDPKRVRHIRGILMEDEEESERHRLCAEDDYEATDGGKGILYKPQYTILTNTNANLYLSVYEFGCYHCDFKSNFKTLREIHWRNVHNADAETAKPFYYTLLNHLRCPECRKFTGNHIDLRRHLSDKHKREVFAAADPLTHGQLQQSLTCGYCNFTCVRSDQLIKHHQQEAHKQSDIKKLSSVQLKDIMKLGSCEIYVQCSLCTEIFANRTAIVAHAHRQHADNQEFSFRELSTIVIYRCAICSFTSTSELTTLRHMIDHYGRFKRCHFCLEPQNDFNGYMQHCYADHRQEIKRFSEIYTLAEIKKFLLQILLLFPNGLMINMKNLHHTEYGKETRIDQLYDEICKTSQQPPIPRLSIASLVARKSIEAKQSIAVSGDASSNLECDRPVSSVSTAAAIQLAGNSSRQSMLTAKKICKRRSTVAFGSAEDSLANPLGGIAMKKSKAYDLFTLPKPRVAAPASFSSLPAQVKKAPKSCTHYGQQPQPIDLNKIYTRMAIGGVDTRISIEKFKLLFKIDARVVVEKINSRDNVQKLGKRDHHDEGSEYRNVKKACPASHKHKYM